MFRQEVEAGATIRLQRFHQKAERLRFLWFDPACADSFIVSEVQLGVMRVLGETRAPASLFSRGRGFPFPATATGLPGILFSCSVENITPARRILTSVLRVRGLDDGTIGFTQDERDVRGVGRGLPPGVNAPSWMRDAWHGRR